MNFFDAAQFVNPSSLYLIYLTKSFRMAVYYLAAEGQDKLIMSLDS